MLFCSVYVNAEYLQLSPNQISEYANKEIIVPVYSDSDNLPDGIKEKCYLLREEIIPDDEFDIIMEDIDLIGPKKEFESKLSKDAQRNFKEFFEITKWDWVISKHLDCAELAFDDLINLRRQIFLSTVNNYASTNKKNCVDEFLGKVSITLPHALKSNDLSDFRREAVFNSFNEWLDSVEEKYGQSVDDRNISLPEALFSSYKKLADKYSKRDTFIGEKGPLAVARCQRGRPDAGQ